MFLDVPGRFTDTSFQFLLGDREYSLGPTVERQTQWRAGEMLVVDPNGL